MGWPIVPGFDFAGTVEHCGKSSGFRVGQEVFGYSMFGSYSARVVVPAAQLRERPVNIDADCMAGVPAVAATALHCLHLAGTWTKEHSNSINKSKGKTSTVAAAPELLTNNKSCLIHSAAGGVGSMLVQMCKLQG